MAIKINCIVLILATCCSNCLGTISCMDDKGNSVDWFVVYKLPQDSSSSNPLIQNGVAYMYMDVHQQSFSLSQVSLNDSKQAVAHTLQQLYDNYDSQHVMYMMYNDEFPNGTKSFSRGHTKGDVLSDGDSGFWLVHSTPKFPDFAKGSYFWPDNAVRYGQSMLCISMKISEIAKVGRQLLYNNPAVYDYNIPSSFQSQFADFVAVCNGKHIEQSPWNSTAFLTSIGGQSFTSFAKFSSFGEDLYWYWVAPALGDDLLVETWMNGESKLGSWCNGSYNVENVMTVSFDGVESFKETKDHCKWAITKDKKWTCIGDINRMASQFKRAGGTVCAQISGVWEAFNSAIQEVDKCGASGATVIHV